MNSLRRSITLTVAFGSAMLAGSAQAQDSNTYLYIAHAASGRNVSSTTNPEFPVDISANGNCIVKGQSFGEISGPFVGAAADYAFQVSPASTSAPCSNPPILTAPAALAPGTSYLGILTLDASNTVIGQIYPIDLSPIPAGTARYLVANATQQNLTASVTSTPATNGAGGQVSFPASTIREADPPLGPNYASVYLDGTTILATGPVNVEAESRNLYLYVLAGSVTNDSVQIIGPRVVRNVF